MTTEDTLIQMQRDLAELNQQSRYLDSFIERVKGVGTDSIGGWYVSDVHEHIKKMEVSVSKLRKQLQSLF